jgi:hypothetical protein
MSFYDDASLVFLAGGAAGKDGKAYNLKPISPAKDFTFERGTDLTAPYSYTCREGRVY